MLPNGGHFRHITGQLLFDFNIYLYIFGAMVCQALIEHPVPILLYHIGLFNETIVNTDIDIDK